MAKREITLEDFKGIEVDPETHQLFWDGEAVVTALTFQLNTAADWVVVCAIVITAAASSGMAIMRAIEFRQKRREAKRGIGRESGAA